MNRALWLGLGLILLSNAVALGGVWYNRSGEPEARLTLSSRELERVSDALLRGEENSVLRLRLSWRHAAGNARLPWLDAAKLDELGFSAEDLERPLSRQLPRRVWLVLELDGPAYRRQLDGARQALQAAESALQAAPDNEELQRQRDERRRQLQYEEQLASRLMLVDAGVDAEALRRRWPDRRRQVLLSGRIEPYRHGAQADYGASIRLDGARLSLPRANRELFRGWPWGHDETGPKVQVEVAFGRRHEPWVLSVRQ